MTGKQFPFPNSSDDSSRVISESTTFQDWQVQLKLACEADRRDDIAAIVSLRLPRSVVLRHVTVVREPAQTLVTADSLLFSSGAQRTTYRDEVVPATAMRARDDCPPLPDFPEPGSPAAEAFLRHLLRDPYEFSGSCLFWMKTVDALRLLEEKGASTHDKGWMGVPLLVYMAERGHENIVRFLIEQRGHDPNIPRADGRYTALHWATGLDLVRYLIEQGADCKALTSFGDSVVAQQIRSGQADVVDYLLGLGEERVSRANLLQWLEARPEMLRVLCRHDIAMGEPIAPNFGEDHAPLALHRILQSGIENRQSGPGDGKDLLECVDILLAQGWDPTLRDSGGRLPYHMVQDLLPDTDDPLRQQLDARLSRFDGPRKRPRRKKFMNWF